MQVRRSRELVSFFTGEDEILDNLCPVYRAAASTDFATRSLMELIPRCPEVLLPIALTVDDYSSGH